MRGKQVAVIAFALVVAAGLLAYPAFANTGTQVSTGSTNPAPSLGHGFRTFLRDVIHAFGRSGHGQSSATFSAGQSFTLTSTSGKYLVLGSAGKGTGTASGTLVFTVEGKLSAGYTVSVAGSLTIGSNSFTLSSGSGVMGPGGQLLRGQGSLAQSGSFIMLAGAKGGFVASPTGTVLVDLSSGGTNYVVHLTGGIQG